MIESEHDTQAPQKGALYNWAKEQGDALLSDAPWDNDVAKEKLETLLASDDVELNYAGTSAVQAFVQTVLFGTDSGLSANQLQIFSDMLDLFANHDITPKQGEAIAIPVGTSAVAQATTDKPLLSQLKRDYLETSPVEGGMVTVPLAVCVEALRASPQQNLPFRNRDVTPPTQPVGTTVETVSAESTQGIFCPGTAASHRTKS